MKCNGLRFQGNILILGYASGCSAFYVSLCLRKLCKKVVQQIHQKQLSSFYFCFKIDFKFLSYI